LNKFCVPTTRFRKKNNSLFKWKYKYCWCT